MVRRNEEMERKSRDISMLNRKIDALAAVQGTDQPTGELSQQSSCCSMKMHQMCELQLKYSCLQGRIRLHGWRPAFCAHPALSC